MANSRGQEAQEKTRYFCHSCGGVTVSLTPQEAAEDRSHGHDLEAYPLQPRQAEVIRG